MFLHSNKQIPKMTIIKTKSKSKKQTKSKSRMFSTKKKTMNHGGLREIKKKQKIAKRGTMKKIMVKGKGNKRSRVMMGGSSKAKRSKSVTSSSEQETHGQQTPHAQHMKPKQTIVYVSNPSELPKNSTSIVTLPVYAQPKNRNLRGHNLF